MQRGQPLIPAAVPVGVTLMDGDKAKPLIVYRSHWGVHAVAADTGRLEWEAPTAWSPDRVLQDPKRGPVYWDWLDGRGGTR